MKTIKKHLLLILILFKVAMASAQDYNTGIGLRLGGFTSGITVKHFVKSNGAIEGIVGFGSHSFILTGLYEHHFPVDAEGLKLYVGGGMHVGWFGYNGTYLIYKNRSEKIYVVESGRTAFVPGIDFIFGAEYKFKGAPLTLGLDIKPFVDFYYGTSAYTDVALNLRYVF